MDETWIEKTEGYLNGEMSTQDRLQFESDIATDQELSYLVNVYRTIETEMRSTHTFSKEETALRGTLAKLNNIYFNNADHTGNSITGRNTPENETGTKQSPVKHIGNISAWKMPAAAAALLAIVLLGLLWFFNSRQHNRQVVNRYKDSGRLNNKPADTTGHTTSGIPPHPLHAPAADITAQDRQKPDTGKNRRLFPNAARRRQLYAANFSADTLPADIPPSLQQSMADYKAGHYGEALAGFEAAGIDLSARGTDQDNMRLPFYIHYYRAQSFLATNQAAKAIAELHEAARTGSGPAVSSKINWYLALAYLKNGDPEHAELLLKQVAGTNTAGQYKYKAAGLLAELAR